jgi:cellulose synthase/poly-beta-1,6-N-acetylglucosamine synthase-like glycosyltransferase
VAGDGTAMTALRAGVEWLLTAIVLTGVLPLLVGSLLFLLVAFRFRWNHYGKCEPWFPRTTVLVPAWNEGAVIGPAIDGLMQLDYPPEALRVLVVDDASTDETPQVVRAKAERYPGQVVHLRREKGGEGKAAALNHGLRLALAEDWTEAVLITDADVIYEPATLRLMTRHLADSRVGAVTAYIKEGSRPGNYMTRFVAYEYIIGQAVSRRSQEVLGAMACLAGGVQLHVRSSIEAIGGRLDTTTLAEDTVTTIATQQTGRRVAFEPHATVWAEEPGSIGALWKQRMRWARGNLQVSWLFRRMWFRPQRLSRLGSVAFGLQWFCLLLQPLFMIGGSVSLVILYLVHDRLAFNAFRALWLTNVATYTFIAVYALLVDPATARRTWPDAIMYPGVVNLITMAAVIVTVPLHRLAVGAFSLAGARLTPSWVEGVLLFVYVWQAGCMAVAYLAKVAEPRRLGWLVSRVLIYIAGYGALQCAVTFGAYLKELTGAEAGWDKTEKTGKMAAPA